MESKEISHKLTRIAIIDPNKCKPKKCAQECRRLCPVVKIGKLCIEVTPSDSIAKISESLCNGCNICTKHCPFSAIDIINLPTNLNTETSHRYGPNLFKLHRLPIPTRGQILGLVGANGLGKSTALMILTGKIKPNLGNYQQPPDWLEIIKHYKGSELQNYLTQLLEDKLIAVFKPQYVDAVNKTVKGKVIDLIKKYSDDQKEIDSILEDFDLQNLKDRNLEELSGGETQRFCIAITCISNADIYVFDEPSSYLDVYQRMKMSNRIRKLKELNKYIIVVEHDLSILDYMSDTICCLYGKPGGYGIVTLPYTTKEGINVYLSGFIPTENMRFRNDIIDFHLKDSQDEIIERTKLFEYPAISKTLDTFKFQAEMGTLNTSEITVIVGLNGLGKTLFMKMLAGVLKSDNIDIILPRISISYKPQKISPHFDGTVRELFHNKIPTMYTHPQFQNDIIKPLGVNELLDQEIKKLSGGQLQTVGICLCLGKPADCYLLDEPSAYLDIEKRIIVSKVIKKHIYTIKKSCIVVEHDFLLSTYLADRIIVFEGTPGINGSATQPKSLTEGMNNFLKIMNITFRRDNTNYRARINKLNSQMDIIQKKSGNYFHNE